MTADLDRLRAAQAKADVIVRQVADYDGGYGPRLMVAVIDPETNTRLATAFVACTVAPAAEPEPPACLAPVLPLRR